MNTVELSTEIDITGCDGELYSSVKLLDKYGSVVGQDGQTVYLTQDAYLSYCPFEGSLYEASGVDMQGHSYVVLWSIIPGQEDNPDESERCVWDSPTSVVKH